MRRATTATTSRTTAAITSASWVCAATVCRAGEQCDDANQSNSGYQQHRTARCGDGHVREGLEEGQKGYEACDDRNQTETDACRNDCTERCGDSIVMPT